MNQSEFKKQMEAAGFSEQDILELASRLVASAAEDQIANGELDPTGKDATQIGLEAAKRFLRELTPGRDIAFSVCHRRELLERARVSRRNGESEIACLFYATWLEHWVNLLLVRSRSKLNSGERTQILREISLKAKFSWMLVALGYPRISAAHLERVTQVAEIRNAFVHYKWRAKLEKEADQESERIAKSLAGIEKTIRYLLQFEDKHLLKGSKRVLAQLTPKPKNRK